MKVSRPSTRDSSSQVKQMASRTGRSLSTSLTPERDQLDLAVFDKFTAIANPYLRESARSGILGDGNARRTLKYGFGKLLGPSGTYHVHRHLDHCSLSPSCFSFPRSIASYPFGAVSDLFKYISQPFGKRFEGLSKSGQTDGPSLNYKRSGQPITLRHKKSEDIGPKIESQKVEIDRMMAIAGKLFSPDGVQVLSRLNGQEVQVRRANIRRTM